MQTLIPRIKQSMNMDSRYVSYKIYTTHFSYYKYLRLCPLPPQDICHVKHSHTKQIVTERPKTPEMTSKKTLLSLKGISRFCVNLDETKVDMVQFTKRWN